MEFCPDLGGTELTVETEPPRACTSCSLNAGGTQHLPLPHLRADLPWALVGLLI